MRFHTEKRITRSLLTVLRRPLYSIDVFRSFYFLFFDDTFRQLSREAFVNGMAEFLFFFFFILAEFCEHEKEQILSSPG